MQILRDNVSTRNYAHPNFGKPEEFTCKLSQIYSKISFILPDMILRCYVMCPLTCLSLSPVQADQKGGAGAASLDLELLKPLRVAAVASDRLGRSGAPDTMSLEYI
jgi:hypothetical protein